MYGEDASSSGAGSGSGGGAAIPYDYSSNTKCIATSIDQYIISIIHLLKNSLVPI